MANVNKDDRLSQLRELENRASMNWALAQRAEREGNEELAFQLAAIAREADAMAISRRDGAAVCY